MLWLPLVLFGRVRGHVGRSATTCVSVHGVSSTWGTDPLPLWLADKNERTPKPLMLL